MADDVQTITNLVYSYAELLDTGDIEGLGRLFTAATLRRERGAARPSRSRPLSSRLSLDS